MSLHDDMCPIIYWYCSTQVGRWHWQNLRKDRWCWRWLGVKTEMGEPWNCAAWWFTSVKNGRIIASWQFVRKFCKTNQCLWHTWCWWLPKNVQDDDDICSELRTLQIPRRQCVWFLNLRYQDLPRGIDWILAALLVFSRTSVMCYLSLG
jgi:hypothetical protein